MPKHYIELNKIRSDKRKAKVRKILHHAKEGARKFGSKTLVIGKVVGKTIGKGAVVVGKHAARGAVMTAKDLRKGAVALNKRRGSTGAFDLGFADPPRKKKKKGQDDFNIFGGL